MLIITQIIYDTNISVLSYTRHNLTILKQDMIYWQLNPELNTWEILRLFSPISFDIKTHLLPLTSYIGETFVVSLDHVDLIPQEE